MSWFSFSALLFNLFLIVMTRFILHTNSFSSSVAASQMQSFSKLAGRLSVKGPVVASAFVEHMVSAASTQW